MTHNPNQAPSIAPELSTEERALLSIDKLNEWRGRQHHTLSDLRAADFLNHSSADDFSASIDSTLDEFLEQNGLAADSANYGEIRALFREASIDNFTEDEWGNSPASRGTDPDDHMSQSDRFEERIEQRLADGGDQDTEDTPSVELDAEKVAAIDELEDQLNDLREQMAEMTAKRQDTFFSLKKNAKRDALRDEYHALVQELGRRHLALHEDASDEEKNLIAMTVLFDEQEKLRQETIAELEDKPLGKFIKWMNKGNVATRIAKGVGIGALAGVSGAFVAGAVGAGVVAGGAVMASRFARNFALKDNKTRGMASIFSEGGKSSAIDFDADVLNTGAALNFTDDANRMENIQALTGANKAFEDDTKKEQEKRRKSAMYGTAMMGAGALIGYGIHEGAEYLSGKNLTVTHWLHEKWDNFWNVEDNGHLPPPPPTGNTGIDHGGGHTPTHKPSISWADFAPSAHMVTPGEGWYQTFQELNIPQDHWADVLKDAGPKLHEQGLAYWDNAHSEWRISHTGKLPTSALKVIAAASKRDGYTLAS